LAWSQEDLAVAADVSVPTIKRLEAQDGPLGGRDQTGIKIRSAPVWSSLTRTAAARGCGYENGNRRRVKLPPENQPLPV